ncbi:MAG TPA: Fur family transcriptional regulator [Polyangiaceae bacterium]|jgi:Fur family ferric uptake transcriptional regulator|nr:Fur family transcriptional regulator [Polyangiaceae bacterium]
MPLLDPPADVGITVSMGKGKEDGMAPIGAHKGPNRQVLRKRLDAYMAEQGLRSTDQRRLIIDTLFHAPSHLTVEELLEQVRRADPKVGYATVYRTMKMLASGGIVEESKFGGGFTRYELADQTSHHDHIICVDCGVIQEFEEPMIEELQARVAKRFGFELKMHKYELYGHCLNTQCPHRRAEAGAFPRQKH